MCVCVHAWGSWWGCDGGHCCGVSDAAQQPDTTPNPHNNNTLTYNSPTPPTPSARTGALSCCTPSPGSSAAGACAHARAGGVWVGGSFGSGLVSVVCPTPRQSTIHGRAPTPLQVLTTHLYKHTRTHSYSEFVALDAKLRGAFPEQASKLLPLPPKTYPALLSWLASGKSGGGGGSDKRAPEVRASVLCGVVVLLGRAVGSTGVPFHS